MGDQIRLGNLCSDLTNAISVNQRFLEAGSLSKDCADLSFNAGVETCSVLSFYNINCRPVFFFFFRKVIRRWAEWTKLIPGEISLCWYFMGWSLYMSRLSYGTRPPKKDLKKWMYLSLEGMLCFLWLFWFLFYTQCMYYLWSCFWGVHWFKRICYKRCYKRIYYPVYGSLSTIYHGNILTVHTRSVMFVLRSRKKRKACLFVCATLDTVM